MTTPGEARSPHIFTVDVEEYFQVHAFEGYIQRAEWPFLPSRVVRSTRMLLDLLEARDARATFFVLGWVADRHPELVRQIDAQGHEVASHGWSHRRIRELGPQKFRDDVRRTKAFLEDLLGKPVRGYRAPSFSLVPDTDWAFEVLVQEGYEYDSSVFPIRRLGYGFPGAATEPHLVQTPSGPLLELPLATLKLAGLTLPAAGGAYFRHLPDRLAAGALAQMEARKVPGVFYIHSWEIDRDQPRLPVSLTARFRHYGGLDRVPARLDELLSSFSFTSVAERFHTLGSTGVSDRAPDDGAPDPAPPPLRVLEDGRAAG